MAWSLIATAKGGDTNGGTASGVDTSGADLIILAVSSWPGGNAPVVNDNMSNSYSLAVTINTGIDILLNLYYVQGGTVGSGHTFTVGGSFCYSGFMVYAFSGSVASPLDQTNQNSATSGTSLTTGSITPCHDNELIISLFG